jgi:hypothetical protein
MHVMVENNQQEHGYIENVRDDGQLSIADHCIDEDRTGE